MSLRTALTLLSVAFWIWVSTAIAETYLDPHHAVLVALCIGAIGGGIASARGKYDADKIERNRP